MKKLLTFMLVAILAIGMTGCGNKQQSALNIGITEYPPLNFYENGKLVGFETEFAEEVCRELGVKANFIMIDWGSKEMELKSKNIDVVWNGMTWTPERAENMLLSEKYLNNGGVLVAKKGIGEIKSVAVEKGSQAEKIVDTESYFQDKKVVKIDSITKGFLEVKSGNIDATYCDYIAAVGMLTGKNDYAELEINNAFSNFGDKFALGFRKGDTELCGKINKIMQEMTSDGRLKKIAEKYGLGESL